MQQAIGRKRVSIERNRVCLVRRHLAEISAPHFRPVPHIEDALISASIENRWALMFSRSAIAPAEPRRFRHAVLPGKQGPAGARAADTAPEPAGPSAGIESSAGAVASRFILPVFLLQLLQPRPAKGGNDCNAMPNVSSCCGAAMGHVSRIRSSMFR